jgi:ankyrin repeat protein
MKSSIISAAITICSIPAAFSCPTPQPDASTLFSMIANPKTQVSDVRNFLKSHAIGWDAVNENCQTTFLASLAQDRNDLFKTLYTQYKPDLNQPQPNNSNSIYNYVITAGTVDNLKAVQSVGKHLSLPQDSKTAGITELMLAALYNPHADMIPYLLDNGSNAGAKDNNRQTALLYAAPSRSLDIIQALIQGHSNVNQVDNNGNTPLSLAANNPDHQVVYALIKAGAAIDIKLANTMLVSEASHKDGDIDLMKDLIRRGASVNDDAVLTSAAGSGNPAIVTMIIQAGASANNGFALTAAVESGNPDIVTMLIHAGAGPAINSFSETRDGFQITALMAAATPQSQPEMVKILLQAGADVNVQTEGHESALLLTVERNLYSDYDDKAIEVIRELVQAGSDLTLTYQTTNAERGGYAGLTVFQFATNRNAPQAVLDILNPKTK